jgi:hypothetical protein
MLVRYSPSTFHTLGVDHYSLFQISRIYLCPNHLLCQYCNKIGLFFTFLGFTPKFYLTTTQSIDVDRRARFARSSPTQKRSNDLVLGLKDFEVTSWTNLKFGRKIGGKPRSVKHEFFGLYSTGCHLYVLGGHSFLKRHEKQD